MKTKTQSSRVKRMLNRVSTCLARGKRLTRDTMSDPSSAGHCLSIHFFTHVKTAISEQPNRTYVEPSQHLSRKRKAADLEHGE